MISKFINYTDKKKFRIKRIEIFRTCSGFTPVKFPVEGDEKNPHGTVYPKDSELHYERRCADEPGTFRIVVEILGIIRHLM